MSKATGATYDVHFRRRREGRTDYEKRLAHLKSRKTRLVVRKTNRYVVVAFAGFDVKGDHILTSKSSKSLSKIGFPGKCNTSSAYLTAFWCAKEAQKKGVKEAILDLGLHAPTKGNVLFAALKGAVDAGVQVPFEESILPSEDRIKGKHLGETAVKAFEECKQKLQS